MAFTQENRAPLLATPYTVVLETIPLSSPAITFAVFNHPRITPPRSNAGPCQLTQPYDQLNN
jgi:hypothetical protein